MCEEPEISENKEICKSEISRLKNDYNDKYAFAHEVELLNAETYLPITEFKEDL